MANDITKEEINALMTVQAKSVEQQVIIAERLKVIVDNQEKTLNRLQNGIAKEITENIKETCEDVEKAVCGVKKDTGEIKKDTNWLKWLYGSVGLIVVLSMVFINVYWLSQRAATTKAVTIAVQETLKDCVVEVQSPARGQ